MRSLRNWLGDEFSSSKGQARLLVLTYHRVLPAVDELFPDVVDARRFDAQARMLAEEFNVLSLPEAVELLATQKLPPRAVCISFDDGYRDNREVALPILQRHGLTATFFVATGFLDGGSMWNDRVIESLRIASGPTMDVSERGLGVLDLSDTSARRKSIDNVLDRIKHLPQQERQAIADELVARSKAESLGELMMTSAQVCELRAAGMTIGAHTVSHPILKVTDDKIAEDEIAVGRERLQDLLREPVEFFAYPNGRPGRDYDARHVAMVRRMGFRAAVSTAWGFADSHSDFAQLSRVAPWAKSLRRFQIDLWRAYRDRQTQRA